MGMGGGGSKISLIPFWLVWAVIALSTVIGLVAAIIPPAGP
jgi:hypothetical protein